MVEQIKQGVHTTQAVVVVVVPAVEQMETGVVESLMVVVDQRQVAPIVILRQALNSVTPVHQRLLEVQVRSGFGPVRD